MNNTPSYHALALFSGGLDSILAAKSIQEQGLSVLCLHYFTPFFGKPHKKKHWEKIYGITIKNIDLGEAFVNMMLSRPAHGFGSVLNPCVDCKILMMEHTRTLMATYGAQFIISGEVLGQRPMSQRRDTLNVIQRDGGVKDILLRPLCAKLLNPTQPELDGLVDREKLHAISGRGRTKQMELAAHFNITEIPTPAGGCRLAEKENARGYWPLMTLLPHPTANDFYLANRGRQLWHKSGLPFWLSVGRKERDNQEITKLASPRDIIFKLADFPGPIGLGRVPEEDWPEHVINDAAAVLAGYSTRAVDFAAQNGPVAIRVHTGSLDAPARLVHVLPSKKHDSQWHELAWEDIKGAVKESNLSSIQAK